MSNLSRRIRTVEPVEPKRARRMDKPARKAEPAVAPVGDPVKRGRGRPLSGKKRVTIRLDADVLAAYRSLGEGWQGILNGDLRKIRGI